MITPFTSLTTIILQGFFFSVLFLMNHRLWVQTFSEKLMLYFLSGSTRNYIVSTYTFSLMVKELYYGMDMYGYGWMDT